MLRGWLYRGAEYHNQRRRSRRDANRSGRARSLPLTLEPLEARTLLSFSAPVAIDLGLASARVAVADANGDHFSDVLAADGNTVSVLLGRGDGTFQPPLLSNPGPAGSMVGDVNGDGVPDLAGLQFNEDGYIEGVNTVLGNGDGTFRPGAHFPLPDLPDAVTLGDFDGDRRIDLLANNRVFLGNGDGTFRPASTISSVPSNPRVADFNGDGRLDLAAAGFGSHSVSVQLGNGDGSFQEPVAYDSGLRFPRSLEVADFNGDRLLELLVGGGDTPGRVSVLFGNGDGTFQPARTTDIGVSGGTAADLNGDGFDDLITAVGAGQLRVLLGNGDGTFQPAVSYIAGPSPVVVGVADFSGDGALDLAVANFQGDFGRTGSFVAVLENNGDGTFPSFPAPHPLNFLPSFVAGGDFNSDGAPDLVTVSTFPGGQVSVVLGNGDGTFQPQINTRLSVIFPSGLAVADFDGDGRLDVAVSIDQWQRVIILPGRGDGTFGAERNVPTGRFPGRLVAADLNGDDVPDLAILAKNASAADGVYVHLGNGDGTFGSTRVTSVDQFPTALAAGDFNGDGRTDLAVTTTTNVIVLRGNGDGFFQTPLRYAVDVGAWAVTVARLRPDGPEDIITANGAIQGLGGTISVLRGNGDGTFQEGVNYPVGRSPYGVAVGDFNGGGVPDVAVINGNDGTVSVLLGQGDGSLLVGPRFVVGHIPRGVVAGDFNGDDLLDLMVANGSPGNVSTLLNDGDWPEGPPSISIGDVTITEGNSGTRMATFTVTLSAASSQPVTVAFTTANGNATAGSDYQTASGTVTFTPGERTQTITVLINCDRVGEPNETFVVNLSGATGGAVLTDNQGVGTIVDDEPRISINDVSRQERHSGTSLFVFVVTLSTASDVPVTVNFATANGTATAGSDYTAQSGSITFAPGETSKTISIVVRGDRTREANETFFVNLSSAVNALLLDSQGLGRILNDD